MRKIEVRPLHAIFASVRCNFRGFFKNPVVILTFIMAFILSYLLSIRVMEVAEYFECSVQMAEPFIWIFGDPTSIMLTSILLIFLFSDMPKLNAAAPFYLMRITKRQWLIGQFLYIVFATCIYTGVIMLFTCLLCARYSYVGNIWSKTAMYLAYSSIGTEMNVPSTVKVMESVKPYTCMFWIGGLLLCYCLTLVFLMMAAKLYLNRKSGIFVGFLYSLYGMLLDKDTLRMLIGWDEFEMYRVNSLISWISPLNHAAYGMHDFGHDNQPSLQQSVLIFAGILLALFLLSAFAMKRYNFTFLTTQGNEE